MPKDGGERRQPKEKSEHLDVVWAWVFNWTEEIQDEMWPGVV